MTPGPLDAYVSRLERELRKRGLEDARIIAEAREHLADAVEDGLRRGLSLDAAATEAFERFGAPETVAAHFREGRYQMMTRDIPGFLGTVWQRKWWILAPTVLTAVVTSVMSYYFLPTRYQSEASIRIVRPGVPAEGVRATATDRSGTRLQKISQSILSPTRLERIIRDFDLYKAEQATAPLSDVVLQMRRDINVNVTSRDPQDQDVGGFNVSFVSSDPRRAMKVTERLASLFIEENLRTAEVQAEGTREADIAASLERRQIGEQFKVVDAARLPERPVGPSRLGVNMMGVFAGLALGLVLVGVRGGTSNKSAG